MSTGQWWIGAGHFVQFYDKGTCEQSAANSGNATNRITLVAKYTSMTWNNVKVDDVVEMTNGTETWFFGRGYGLVAWTSAWGWSAICAVHSGRPDLVREKINCQW